MHPGRGGGVTDLLIKCVAGCLHWFSRRDTNAVDVRVELRVDWRKRAAATCHDTLRVSADSHCHRISHPGGNPTATAFDVWRRHNVPLRFGCKYDVDPRPAKSVEKWDPEAAAGLIGKLSISAFWLGHLPMYLCAQCMDSLSFLSTDDHMHLTSPDVRIQ